MTPDTHPWSDPDGDRRLGGVGPFVINLHASTAPIGIPAKNPAAGERARLYQLQRIDDGRVRFRLRLGPFATEDEADAVLMKVRSEYPGALLLTAAADDLHAIALMGGSVAAGGSPADSDARSPLVAVAAAPAALEPARIAPTPERAALPPRQVAPQPERAALPPRQVAPQSERIAPPARQIAPPAVAPQAVAGSVSMPSLESTHTLRPLTVLELGGHEAARWFVVQLGLSDTEFDPDTLPHLDIFSLYRLYTVSGMDQGRLVHALRLGFFGEETGARAVANYLAAFFDAPAIKRVSVAERDRFAERRVEARKDVGALGRHLAIEITDELVIRGRRSSR